LTLGRPRIDSRVIRREHDETAKVGPKAVSGSRVTCIR